VIQAVYLPTYCSNALANSTLTYKGWSFPDAHTAKNADTEAACRPPPCPEKSPRPAPRKSRCPSHLHYRIHSLAPQGLRVAHHGVDYQGDHLARQADPVPQPLPGYLPAPGATTMDRWLAQSAARVEDFPPHACGIASTQGLCGAAFTVGEARLPFFFGDPAVAAIPEAFEYKGVIQEIADGTGIFLPNGIFDAPAAIQI